MANFLSFTASVVGGGRGPEEFKQTISDLRRTVEEQTAEDDTVTTRCIFSGTDRGGVLWYPPTGK
jgi:predicted ester cyclase